MQYTSPHENEEWVSLRPYMAKIFGKLNLDEEFTNLAFTKITKYAVF
jgi:hypothetical protein